MSSLPIVILLMGVLCVLTPLHLALPNRNYLARNNNLPSDILKKKKKKTYKSFLFGEKKWIA